MTARTDTLIRAWEGVPGLYGWLTTVDHKRLGLRYMVTAMGFFVLGGVLAMIMRVQLAVPENHVVDPLTYNELFSMHGTTMIFLFITPLSIGLGTFLVPLMIGSREMAFPRLNAFAYWVFLLAGLFMYASFVVGSAPVGGWFSYTPLTDLDYSPGPNMDFWGLGLLFLGVASTAAAMNFIVTIFRLRAPGMTVGRMPIFVWNILVTAFIILFALPAISAATALLELDRLFGFAFFDVTRGGSSLLWQHLFWIFGHPDVYIIFLPAVGVVSTVIPVFARHRIVGYPLIVLATVSIGILSFGVWVHHMFATGLPPSALAFFSAASIVIAIPSGIQMLAWVTTIWRGTPWFRTPFLYMLGFIFNFLLGGFTGVMVALIPFDLQATDSYFIVAHFHYVLLGSSLFPLIGGLYYWFPKFTGRMYSETLGRLSFWLLFIGFNVTFLPMHIQGMLGMPRRVWTYLPGLGWDQLNMLETIGSFILAAGVLVFMWDMLSSLTRGEVAVRDPWRANTLEWATASPPEPYDFRRIPLVGSADPLWDGTAESTGQALSGDGQPRREVMATSPFDAAPEFVFGMPRDSIWPLVTAVLLALVFVALLLHSVPAAVVFAVAGFLAGVAWLAPAAGEEGTA